jgi:outer membrane receptor for ferrienterochelin and colicin
VGVELRREKLESIPDANYLSGDYIGLVANGTAGSRDSIAAYGELRMPVVKDLELTAALRTENYTDFGNASTGKLGFKWDAIKSTLAFRGPGATGFRAPSILPDQRRVSAVLPQLAGEADLRQPALRFQQPGQPGEQGEPAQPA